jgi:hypothetical protein
LPYAKDSLAPGPFLTFCVYFSVRSRYSGTDRNGRAPRINDFAGLEPIQHPDEVVNLFEVVLVDGERTCQDLLLQTANLDLVNQLDGQPHD